ncbi:hypothetical protein HDV02_004647, partial [Globomyces sp. JEL0801]
MELLDYLNWTVAYQLATSVFSPIAIMYCFSNINTFYSLLFSKPSRIPKPFTTYDFYSLRLLYLSAAISLIFALWPTTNIFDLLNVHPTAPSYLLKSRIDDFSISSPPNLEPLLSALLSNYGQMDKWSDQDLVITSIQQVNDIRSTVFANDLLQTSIQSTPILQQLCQSQFQINQQYFKKFHQQSHIK